MEINSNAQPTQSKTNQRKSKVFGTRQTNNCDGGGVKAGVDIVQKSVVQTDNLCVDCTPALLTDYLLANEIPVSSQNLGYVLMTGKSNSFSCMC